MGIIILLSSFELLSAQTPNAYAQYFGGGDDESLTQEDREKCAQYGIDPCTKNGILAKERLLAAQQSIVLTGMSTNRMYEARIDWVPSELGQTNKFRVQILDANQLEPRDSLPVDYDIRVYKDGKYLLPQDESPYLGDSAEYEFVFLQEGSYTLTIDNISNSAEKIEIPIQVTPEFPFGILGLVAAATVTTLVANSVFRRLSSGP